MLFFPSHLLFPIPSVHLLTIIPPQKICILVLALTYYSCCPPVLMPAITFLMFVNRAS